MNKRPEVNKKKPIETCWNQQLSPSTNHLTSSAFLGFLPLHDLMTWRRQDSNLHLRLLIWPHPAARSRQKVEQFDHPFERRQKSESLSSSKRLDNLIISHYHSLSNLMHNLASSENNTIRQAPIFVGNWHLKSWLVHRNPSIGLVWSPRYNG